MRLFLAVEIDPAVRAAVAGAGARLRAALETLEPGAARRVTWVPPDRAHVTLHFLGEVPARDVARLEVHLREPLAVAPFTVAFGGIGAFPPGRGGPRVLWLGCSSGTEALRSLHRELAGRLAAVPVVVEDRPLSPHLTLGRFREPGAPRLRDAWAGLGTEAVASCGVEAVTLFESRLQPDGPRYTARLRIPLAP